MWRFVNSMCTSSRTVTWTFRTHQNGAMQNQAQPQYWKAWQEQYIPPTPLVSRSALLSQRATASSQPEQVTARLNYGYTVSLTKQSTARPDWTWRPFSLPWMTTHQGHKRQGLDWRCGTAHPICASSDIIHAATDAVCLLLAWQAFCDEGSSCRHLQHSKNSTSWSCVSTNTGVLSKTSLKLLQDSWLVRLACALHVLQGSKQAKAQETRVAIL